MRKISYLLSFVAGCFVFASATAQRIEYSESFLEKLNQLQLTVVEPTDAGYKDVMVLKNDVEGYDLAIRSRREKLEIRYIIEDDEAIEITHHLPHIRFTLLLSQLASNIEDSLPMAIHELPQDEIEELFGADWGQVAYFQPKGNFTHWQYAKLLSLYKTERGMAHILFLYNKSGLALDNRFHAVQFLNEQRTKCNVQLLPSVLRPSFDCDPIHQ